MSPDDLKSSAIHGEIVSHFDESTMPKPNLNLHRWIQLGNQLTCNSCDQSHGSFIETGFQLYGIDDNGYPLIRKIVLEG